MPHARGRSTGYCSILLRRSTTENDAYVLLPLQDHHQRVDLAVVVLCTVVVYNVDHVDTVETMTLDVFYRVVRT